jgi:hypothetical protein
MGWNLDPRQLECGWKMSWFGTPPHTKYLGREVTVRWLVVGGGCWRLVGARVGASWRLFCWLFDGVGLCPVVWVLCPGYGIQKGPKSWREHPVTSLASAYKDTLLTKSRSVNRLLFCHVCHSASSTWTEAQHCLFVRSSTNLIIIQSALDQ